MRLEFINRIKENDILGKSILSSDGKVLLKKGVILTTTYIRKLKEIGVFYAYVEDERLSDINLEDEKLNELKQLTMKSIATIMRNINKCNSKEFNKSLESVERLVSYVIDLKDINKSLCDIKTYDNYTYMHSLHTCVMSCFLGLANSVTKDQLKNLCIGAALHDIGKTKVPIKILNKKGKLTEDEFEEIKRHTIYGGQIIKKNKFIHSAVIDIVEQHHEKVNGKGYPYGLGEKDISPYAKIVSICDVYDAVSSDRCYRTKFNPNDAYELILSEAGTSFDKNLVSKFKNTFSIYPLGCCVRLSSGEEGYVIKQSQGFPDRPTIRVLYDSVTKRPITFYEIDLLKNSNITIKSIV